MLTLISFPSGWTGSPYEESDLETIFSRQCQLLGGDFGSEPTYTAYSQEFNGPDGEFAGHSVIIFGSIADAIDAMNGLVSALERCLVELENEFELLMRRDGIEVNVRSEEMSLTGFEPGLLGIRSGITFPGRSGTLIADQFFVRRSRMIADLGFSYPFGEGPNDTSNRLLSRLIDTMRSRLEQAQE